MTEALWSPSQNDMPGSKLAQFIDFTGYDFKSYDDVHRWSIDQPDAFWRGVWDFCGVIGDRGNAVITPIDHVPFARFFNDSKISFAENMLAQAKRTPDAPAIIVRVQDGLDRVISWRELCEKVSLWQQALEDFGVGEGDKVAVYLPNVPETVILLLAVSNIGAVFASAGMEMGKHDLINRISQIKPKVLISQDFYIHGDKQVSRLDVIEEAKQKISSLEHLVMLGEESAELLSRYQPQDLEFVRREFNRPLYILFSSGSTGKPKCFEHSTGGVLIKHLAEYQLQSDVREGDVVFYHATPSWMMWNWLASGLASGATILMYDGNPFYPDASSQWNFTCTHGCTHHGTAAPVIIGWEKAGLDLTGRDDMNDLRMILSTGAVLPAQSFHYIHDHIKQDVKISSITGGTDLVGVFIGGNPFMPTYAGQVNAPFLGCDVQVWDDNAHELKAGQAGEMVCVNPFPSMPLRFLDDPEGERYRGEYFDYYPDQHVWRHGDTIEKTAEGQFIVIGRSDATLNQNGVRIGPAVIYDELASFTAEVDDYAAVDFIRPDNKQSLTVLFLVCDNLNEDLTGRIKKAVKDNVTPYAIPSEILQVPEILKTPNGKKAEVVMKKILAGKDIPNASLYGEDLVRVYQDIAQNLNKKYAEEAA